MGGGRRVLINIACGVYYIVNYWAIKKTPSVRSKSIILIRTLASGCLMLLGIAGSASLVGSTLVVTRSLVVLVRSLRLQFCVFFVAR